MLTISRRLPLFFIVFFPRSIASDLKEVPQFDCRKMDASVPSMDHNQTVIFTIGVRQKWDEIEMNVREK
jgi:hypothetical protein